MRNLLVKAHEAKSKVTALYVGAVSAMFAPFAMAAGESTEILAVFDEYKTEAILLIVGFAVVLWTLRGAGLLKPRS